MGKGLNDAIHGDRSSIRGYSVAKEPTWDDFESKHGKARDFDGSLWGGKHVD